MRSNFAVKLVGCSLFMLITSACSTAVKTVSSSETYTATSTRPLQVLVATTGPLEGPYAFTRADQVNFGRNLVEEINRHRLATATYGGAPKDLNLYLIFGETTRFDPWTKEYIFTATMTLGSADSKEIIKTYKVNSNQNAGWFTKINSSAAGGKTRAASILLEDILHDLSAYIGSISSKTSNTSIN